MTLRDYLGIDPRARELIVDTKPLALLIVGSIDAKLIRKVKRTRGYEEESFLLLRQFVSEFKRPLITTPNVLTEVSNHLRQGTRWKQVVHGFIAAIRESNELYVASTDLAIRAPGLSSVGLADAGLISLLWHEGDWTRRVLLTEDGPLAGRTEPYSVNFTVLRQMVWALQQ